MKICTIKHKTGIKAVINPAKGATVISLQKDGKEFLYCDTENLASAERPRCGIPFLFPIFGRLKDGRYTWDEKEFSMEIHGFGHTSDWKVAAHTENTLRLVLEDSEVTRSQYPFRFRVTLEFTVGEDGLTIFQTYENRDSSPMPYNYGFHPYFLTEALENIRVETTADTFFDFTAGGKAFGHGSVGLTLPEGALETGAAFMGVHGPTILHNESEGKRRKITHCSFGNVKEQPLADIWNSKAYKTFRRKFDDFEFASCLYCGHCELFEENKEDCIGNTHPTCGGCL